ncbi:MAG: hypothetical protein D6696_21410 [Acidobacteria bacterium]|nr:MAG: hypothetical protein D6696_21410 [Acidobacteriota bacterium]
MVERRAKAPEREVRWERMFPDQLEAAFDAVPAVYLTYGLCEPHGPHAALGLDALKAHALAVRAARRHGGIVAPPDFWHVHEIGGYAIWAEREIGEARPWLTAEPPWLHFKRICYHLRAMEVLGFRAAILLSGHYGPNYLDLRTLVELIQGELRLRLYGLPDFEANRPGFPGDGADGDHAGKVETSLLMALEPACVDLGRLPATAAASAEERFAAGADAARSSAEAGRRMAAGIVAWLGEKQRQLLAAYDPERPSRLRTFGDVERFWVRRVKPRLRHFASMQASWYDKPAPDPASRWYANWRPPDDPP